MELPLNEELCEALKEAAAEAENEALGLEVVEGSAEAVKLALPLPDHEACSLEVPVTEVDPLFEGHAVAVPLSDALALAQELTLCVMGAEGDTEGESHDDLVVETDAEVQALLLGEPLGKLLFDAEGVSEGTEDPLTELVVDGQYEPETDAVTLLEGLSAPLAEKKGDTEPDWVPVKLTEPDAEGEAEAETPEDGDTEPEPVPSALGLPLEEPLGERLPDAVVQPLCEPIPLPLADAEGQLETDAEAVPEMCEDGDGEPLEVPGTVTEPEPEALLDTDREIVAEGELLDDTEGDAETEPLLLREPVTELQPDPDGWLLTVTDSVTEGLLLALGDPLVDPEALMLAETDAVAEL